MKSHRALVVRYCVAFALSIAPFVHAQTPAARPKSHPLWKIEDTNNVVYLLGSIHLLKPDNYPLSAPIESAYSNSQIVVFETDLSKLQSPENQMLLLSKAQLPEGEMLRDHLSAETYAAFTNHLEKLGLPAAVFAQMKPSLAALTLSMIELQRLGFSPEHGVDKHFDERARKDGKTIQGLESAEFQINMITEISKGDAELLMKTTLKDIDKIQKLYNEMFDAWKTGDAAALEKFLNDNLKDAPNIAKRLLTDRNHQWLPKIQQLIAGNQNALVIVGAGHLVGDEGVVELLRKKGLKVTQQ